MTKVYQILCIILLVIVLILSGINKCKNIEVEKYKNKWEQAESKANNLQEKLNANMAADKQKEKLKNTMDQSQDINNLKHIPDISILEQLRSSPV